jgi:hypothetical protein
MTDYWNKINRRSPIDIYRANHHGSADSSTPALAKALDPLVVIYSTGGAYGHPKAETVQRFAAADQFVTSGVSKDTWPKGLPKRLGSVVGEIEILVDANGSRFQVNGAVYASH